ncbi:MAG: methyltransferase domain-containing protein [Deltaproteobacteria bacterium]
MRREDARAHFVKRAQKYDSSSRWVDDPQLIRKISALADAGTSSIVLDIAVGTGKLASAFHGKVKLVVGVDICPQMASHARGGTDSIVLAPAENLPFKDNSFDACVCRQGLQFMDLSRAIPEIQRVLKPGGSFVACHLTSYGEEDKETAFLIQRLRNPARKNFFLPGDIPALFRKNGFVDIVPLDYISRESVMQWITHGAIGKDRMDKIMEAYRNAPEEFKKTHGVSFVEGDILDSMKLVIVRAKKP